jgi:glc operon protein GlcG
MMAVHKGVGHYGAPITLDQVKKVMAAAEAKARQNSWNVVISIVDSGGHAVMLQRLDGSHLAAIGIAEGKARTAVEFRRPTKALEDAMARGGVGLKYFTVRGATLIEGGIPIVVDGKIVGGIGVSGGTSSLSAFAVLRLSTVSYLVGACTGRAAGFSPLRMPIADRAPVGLNRIRPVIRPPGLHPSPNVAGPDGLQPWLAYWFLGRSLGQAFRVA